MNDQIKINFKLDTEVDINVWPYCAIKKLQPENYNSK